MGLTNKKLVTCQHKFKPDYLKIDFACDKPNIPNGKFCIFHDQDHYAEHEQEAVEEFEKKVKKSIDDNKPLECFGYYIPEINFAGLLEGKSFTQPVYFNEATFYGKVDFSEAKFSNRAEFVDATFSKKVHFFHATFSKEADFVDAKFFKEAIFSGAKFSEEATFKAAKFSNVAYFVGATFSREVNFFHTTFSKKVNFENTVFSGAGFYDAKFLDEVYFRDNEFKGKTFFTNVLFEQQNKVKFDNNDLSDVSFADSDITRIRFGNRITWGGQDGFTIIEEEWLKRNAQEGNDVKDGEAVEKKEEEDEEDVAGLESVSSVYRSLRENYEFRLRYDDAGKFFIKEMELKRRYRDIKTDSGNKTQENGWFRRNLSLTGLYYHLSRYGESISRPTLIGLITVLLSTLFWLAQSNPTLEPHFSFFTDSAGASLADSNLAHSTYVGLEEIGNGTHWLRAFERSFADFLPLLSLGGDFKVGVIDYIIKIVGGALTFGLLLIAFRRKFERKYTR